MAFWCDDTICVHVEGPEGGRDVIVAQPYAQIGSHPGSAVVLEGPGVHRRALFLLATKVGVYALNLDREEAPLDEHGRWITSDEPIVVGPYQIAITLASGKTAAAGLPDLVAARSALPIPVLHVFADGLLKDRRRVRNPLSLVGRRPQCGLQLRSANVSSYHAVLYWQDQRLWCVDLGSANGTLLNGEPFVCAEVKLNDRLEIGEFELLHYRWSPRNATPGMENMVGEEEGGVWDSQGGDLAVEASQQHREDSRTSTPVSEPSAFDEVQFRQRLMAELDDRVATEREARAADQSAWQAEREALLGELSDHRAELRRLKAELQVARDAQRKLEAERTIRAEQHEGQPTDVTSGEAIPAPHLPFNAGANGQREPGVSGENDSLPVLLPSPKSPETPMPIETGEADASAMTEATAVMVKPGALRRRQPRSELTSFVSSRLSDLEHVQRRRLLLTWTVAMAGALTLAAIGFGIWAWLFR